MRTDYLKAGIVDNPTLDRNLLKDTLAGNSPSSLLELDGFNDNLTVPFRQISTAALSCVLK
jgi:hypothetical protein